MGEEKEAETHARVVLGVGKVSCLERCPQFSSALIQRGSAVSSLDVQGMSMSIPGRLAIAEMPDVLIILRIVSLR